LSAARRGAGPGRPDERAAGFPCHRSRGLRGLHHPSGRNGPARPPTALAAAPVAPLDEQGNQPLPPVAAGIGQPALGTAPGGLPAESVAAASDTGLFAL